jgi:hypothetical protein
MLLANNKYIISQINKLIISSSDVYSAQFDKLNDDNYYR